MLTLFGRGLTRPVGFETDQSEEQGQVEDEGVKEKKSKDLIDAYKLLVRKGSVPGHLAICWGIITAALGLALGKVFMMILPFSLSPHYFDLLSFYLHLPPEYIPQSLYLPLYHHFISLFLNANAQTDPSTSTYSSTPDPSSQQQYE